MQRRASGRPASALEADMDRLFSKKVTVFGPVSLGDSTEVVLNTVLKVRTISVFPLYLCLIFQGRLSRLNTLTNMHFFTLWF